MRHQANEPPATPPPAESVEWQALAKETRALVGDRDVMEILAEQDSRLRGLLTGMSEVAYRTPEGDERWSASHVVAHLVDTELAWSFRIRQVATEDRPIMQDFDLGRWARDLGGEDEDRDEALRLLAALRRRNLRFFRALSAEGWERCGIHSRRGPESLREIARLLAGHDLRHRHQLQRLREQLGLDTVTDAARSAYTIRAARASDRDPVLALLPRLEAFGPPDNVPAGSLAAGEARAMASAFEQMPDGAALLVAVDPSDAIGGVLFLETRIDYFTGAPHGHVGVLLVSLAAEGSGLGRALLAAADAWGRVAGFDRLTLSVFDANGRARRLYERAGYRADLVRYRKDLELDS